MYRVILKGKFKERPINLARAVKLIYRQDFSGSLRRENISWWKQYWIKPVYLQIIYPKKGWITLVKVYRRGQGAFLSSGSRPRTSMQSWSLGRVNSFLRGSRKHDTDLRRKKKK